MGKLENVDLKAALKSGEGIDVALDAFADKIQTRVLDEAKQLGNDRAVLAERSGLSLTGEEREYFMAVIAAGKGFSEVDQLVPPTLINRVFDNLVKDRPLLRMIDMVNVGLSTEWIFSVGVNPAFWGALCSNIQELQDKGFRKVNISQMKLSAFMPVCKAFLELNSPEWLAQYVITVLTEAIQMALEDAIVDGTGKNQPIGMRRSIANVASEEHTVTEAIEIEKLDVETAGQIMAAISKITIEDGVVIERNVNPADVAVVVNPQTRWLKLFAMFTSQNLNGVYTTNMPLPFVIVESTAVPEDELVIGRAADYFFGLGLGTKITQSDEYRFVEDERIYLAKMYGNGQPKFDGAFKRYTLKTSAEA
nr:MAG TPA: major capsid protein [Caudoviricetes sp.]